MCHTSLDGAIHAAHLIKPALSFPLSDWVESNLITHAAVCFYYCNIRKRQALNGTFGGSIDKHGFYVSSRGILPFEML